MTRKEVERALFDREKVQDLYKLRTEVMEDRAMLKIIAEHTTNLSKKINRVNNTLSGMEVALIMALLWLAALSISFLSLHFLSK